MDILTATELTRHALIVAVYLCVPPVVSVALAGIATGILQSSIGLNDGTVAFVPRIAAAIGAVSVFGTWMVAVSTSFCTKLWSSIPELLG